MRADGFVVALEEPEFEAVFERGRQRPKNYHRCTMIDISRLAPRGIFKGRTMRVTPIKAVSLVVLLGLTQAVAAQSQQGLRQPDVIYVPTRQAVVDAMLKVANVKAGDVVYDLGCGDGRIVVSAAKMGARGIG